jgi:hypothetical protein
MALKRVPLGAIPRILPFDDGVDLMFTAGRCKKTKSRFCDAGTVWRVAVFPAGAAAATCSTGTGAGGSGQASTESGAGYCPGILGAAGTGATGEDCTTAVVSAACVLAFSPADGQKMYASAATPNAVTTAVPIISFRCDPKLVRIWCRSVCSAGRKECSSLWGGPKSRPRDQHRCQ